MVFPKCRVADVLRIENSGFASELYEFALQSHFDFVIADADNWPIFALGFDGPSHSNIKQIERDAKKRSLSERFRLPLHRVRYDAADPINGLERLVVPLIEQSAKSGQRVCPLCSANLAERDGLHGPFLGCVRYPACEELGTY